MFKIYGNIWGWYVFLQVALCLVAICISFRSSLNSLVRVAVAVERGAKSDGERERRKRSRQREQEAEMPFSVWIGNAISVCCHYKYIWKCVHRAELLSAITVIKVKDSFLYFYRYWLLERTNQTLFLLKKRNSFNAKKLLYCRHYSSSRFFFSLCSLQIFCCFPFSLSLCRLTLIDLEPPNGCFPNGGAQ